ncbi:MAG: YIP1 family protein [Bacillota bacterium]
MGEKLKRAGNIFLDPVKVFQELREEKDWVFPLIVIIIASIIASFFVYDVVSSPEYMEEMHQEMEEELSEEELQQMQGEQNDSYVMLIIIVSTFVGGLFVFLFIYLLLALFLWLMGKFKSKEYPFSQTFSVAAYIGLVGSLGNILNGVLIYLQRDPELEINLALIFPGLEGVMDTIANQVNIFGIWLVILLVLAVSVFYEVKKKKLFLLLFVLWAVFNVFQYYLGTLF